MARKKSDDGSTLYRIRKVGTDSYLSGYRDEIPIFKNRPKDIKTAKDVEDELIRYNFGRHRHVKAGNLGWPPVEVVTYAVSPVTVLADPTPDLSHAAKFLTKVDHHDWSSLGRFVKKLAMGGITFRYLVWADGNHPVPAINAKRVQRNSLARRYVQHGSRTQGETLLALDNDNDLIYAKLQLQDHLVGIWDYTKCKTLYQTKDIV